MLKENFQTAEDWLTKWDAGEPCWTIEMGGIGPGYEQCTQLTAAEILRFLIAEKPDATLWDDKEKWAEWRDKIQDIAMEAPACKKLGLSGGQVGAATSLATGFYMRGPAQCFTEVPEDRLILASNNLQPAA